MPEPVRDRFRRRHGEHLEQCGGGEQVLRYWSYDRVRSSVHPRECEERGSLGGTANTDGCLVAGPPPSWRGNCGHVRPHQQGGGPHGRVARWPRAVINRSPGCRVGLARRAPAWPRSRPRAAWCRGWAAGCPTREAGHWRAPVACPDANAAQADLRRVPQHVGGAAKRSNRHGRRAHALQSDRDRATALARRPV